MRRRFLGIWGYEGIPGSKISMRIGLEKSCYVSGETPSMWSSQAEVFRCAMEGPVTTLRS